MKDKTGTPLPTPVKTPNTYSASVVAALTTRNLFLESQLQIIGTDYQAAVDDSNGDRERMRTMEEELHLCADRSRHIENEL